MRIRRAVLSTTMILLAEVGYAAIELPEIAHRAGVHPATVYRRWGTKARLVGEAMLEQAVPLSPTPDTGSLQSDLERLATEGAALMSSPPVQALFEVLMSSAFGPSPEITDARDKFWEAHRAEAKKIVERAVTRGELAVGTDPAELIELVIGPALVRLVISGRPMDAKLAQTVSARVVAAFSTW